MEGTEESIVLDIGSYFTRAGLSGHDIPKLQVPTVVGRPILASAQSLDNKDLYIGKDVLEKKDILNLTYPVKHSSVQNWEEIERIFHNIFFNDLVVDPTQHFVALTQSPLEKRSNKEKLMEMMFETFTARGIYLANSSVMSLFATGRTTGTVIESGLNQTFVSPIYEGYSLPYCIQKMPIGGEEITNFLITNLKERGHELPATKEFEVAQEMKEKVCFLSSDFQQELNSTSRKPYEMPDGSVINLTIERFRTPEALFQPMLIGKEGPGIQELTYNAIMSCDGDIRKELFGNIVLSGGNTMFPKIKEKVWRDVKALAPSNIEAKVKAPPERKNLAWIGTAILTSLSGFKMWVTKQEYEESGPTALYRKTF